MTIFDDIIINVANNLPIFNKFLIIDYRREQIENCMNFMDIVFNETIRLIKQDIIYLGSRILTPEERVVFELKNNITPSIFNIRTTELILVEYQFRFKDMEFATNLYLPYLYDDFIIINNTRYNVQFNITDKVFSCSDKTLTTRVIRSPIRFRIQSHAINSANRKKQYIFPLVLIDIHYQKTKRKNKKKIQKTIIHYLICKFGFYNTLKMFNIKEDDIEFIKQTKDFRMDYEYFEIYPTIKTSHMLKVKSNVMNNKVKKHVILTVLYILSDFRNVKISEILHPDPIKWKTMLGQLIEGTSITLAVALQKAEKHIDSLDSYLDFISLKRYESFGLKNIKNIYDLFVYVFLNIESILYKSEPNDMFEKRLDLIEQVLIDTIVSNIYKKIYKQKNLSSVQREDVIKKIFNIKARSIYSIYLGDNIRSNPACYNDNMFFNYYSKMNYPSSKKRVNGQIVRNKKLSINKNSFHLSFSLVESLLGYSSNNPNKSGSVNPFININKYGGFLKPPYLDLIKSYEKYLK